VFNLRNKGIGHPIFFYKKTGKVLKTIWLQKRSNWRCKKIDKAFRKIGPNLNLKVFRRIDHHCSIKFYAFLIFFRAFSQNSEKNKKCAFRVFCAKRSWLNHEQYVKPSYIEMHKVLKLYKIDTIEMRMIIKLRCQSFLPKLDKKFFQQHFFSQVSMTK
jgi:hypothetical protein